MAPALKTLTGLVVAHTLIKLQPGPAPGMAPVQIPLATMFTFLRCS